MEKTSKEKKEKQMGKTGYFIVIEGGEGAGKTTQLKLLKDQMGDHLEVTREPGGTEYAEEIRHVILKSPNAAQADANTLFSLFWAARADHLKNRIIPALKQDRLVVCDRFDSSTYAYQVIAQGESHLKDFFWAARDFYLGEFKPDLYIYLNIDPIAGLSRKTNQGAEEQNHFEDRKLEFHSKMREGFYEFFQKVPHVVIDASRSIEDIHEDIVQIIYENYSGLR